MSIDTMYPAGPSDVPAAFTRPSASYRRHAWIAVGSLILFIALYLALTAWFVLIGVSELRKLASHGGFLQFLVGVSSLFLAVFMTKGLFFVKKSGESRGIELTRAGQPRLFAFLDRIADDAGAPRPHKVFVTARVNAAVFYDLSLVNLLFPSRKNLEIGLGLVNMLNLSELKAVLAHEFGHFAQRSMAVGRWVYTTQQIAAHIVARRDAFDRFLQGLSRFDFRIAWVGWLLGSVIWALRAVVDVAFRLVVIAQRALSREMEMQADLVSVSLAGSDALVNALHRLQMVDDAWERSLHFFRGEVGAKLPPHDVFAVHEAVAQRLSRIYNDPTYGIRPDIPAEGAAQFRVFNGELAQPPRMWSTHPMNHEREHNAKRVYLAALIDERSGWLVFDDAEDLRERVTRELAGETEHPPATLDVTLERLDTQFGREHLKAHYRGIYLGFSPVRHAKSVDELHEQAVVVRPLELDSLYPGRISDDLERLRSLEREHALLRSLRDRIYDAPDGVIRHRGRILRRNELPAAIDLVDKDLAAMRAHLEGIVKSVRSRHLAAAAKISPAWHAYLLGVLGILHYADHAEANLRDAHSNLALTWQRVTAGGSIREKGALQIVSASKDVFQALQQAFYLARQVEPGEKVLAQLGCESWPAALGELRLNPPSRDNINEWLRVVDGWFSHTAGALAALRRAALDELLATEATVAAATHGTAPPDAPAVAPAIPMSYNTLLTGAERGWRVEKPGFWERFRTASGFFPGLARTVVATAIVGSVLVFGWTVDRVKLHVYNALARPVVTTVAGHRLELAPAAHGEIDVDGGGDVKVTTQAMDGEPIETFTAPVDASETQLVYTVAAAAPMRQWTAVYGNVKPSPPTVLTPRRWQSPYEDYVFAQPPARIQSSSPGGETRTVMDAIDNTAPDLYVGDVKNQQARESMVLAHVRYDTPDSPYLVNWLALGAPLPGFGEALAARRAHFPIDVVAMRAEQNVAKGAGHDAVCARHRALADASPASGDLAYLAARCMVPGPARDEAFEKGYQRWPDSPWFANAAGVAAGEHAHYAEALARYRVAMDRSPALRQAMAPEAFRIERLLDPAAAERRQGAFARQSPWIMNMLAFESQTLPPEGPYRAIALLARGELDEAVRMATGTPVSAHVLRMAAASRGASPALRARAAALRLTDGMDAQTVWIALAAGADAADPAVSSVLDEVEKGYDAPGCIAKMQRFLARIRQGNPAVAEGELDGVPLALRAQAFVAATYVLGDRTPESWRRFATRALFAAERPYLG